MSERVKRLTEEVRQLSPNERTELLDALTEMVREDDCDASSAVLEEYERWDEIGASSLGYIAGKK